MNKKGKYSTVTLDKKKSVSMLFNIVTIKYFLEYYLIATETLFPPLPVRANIKQCYCYVLRFRNFNI